MEKKKTDHTDIKVKKSKPGPDGPSARKRISVSKKAAPGKKRSPKKTGSGTRESRNTKKKSPPARKRGRPLFALFMIRLFFFVFSLLLIPLATAVVAYYHFSQDLPDIDALQTYRPKTVSYIYADDGQLIGEFSHEHRLVVGLEQIPRHVVLAFVAAEDSNFFNHPGLDYLGIVRAMIKNLKARRIVQGASTITQQVTRSFLLSNERSFERKIKEALLAFRIEKNLSKEQILHLYLNQIYLGHGAYGVESAAQIYFGKHVTQLTIGEAAVIAGLTKAPSRYSPFTNMKMAKLRKSYVVNRMLESGFITHDEAVDSMKEEIELKERDDPTWKKTPQFTEHIRRTIEAMYGPERLYLDGLRVYTTVNVDMQHYALKCVRDGLTALARRQGEYSGPVKKLKASDIPVFLGKQDIRDLEPGQDYEAVITGIDERRKTLEVQVGDHTGIVDKKYITPFVVGKKFGDVFARGHVIPVKALPPDTPKKSKKSKEEPTPVQNFEFTPMPNAHGALVCMETKTGQVKAMIGSRDFKESQFNRAVQARRQPGSSFKPFVYSAAIDNGFTQASNINDVETVYKDRGGSWMPKNYGRSYGGPTTLYSGLSRSVNVVAVRLLEMVGPEKVIEYAHKMGIKSPLGPNLSLALGTSEVTLLEMVAAFTTFPNLGERVEPMFITRIEDRDGKIITEFGPQRIRALDPDTAYVVLDMMRGVVTRGTARRALALKRPVAGKTGTTNDLADAWFVGYTPEYATGAWVGRDVQISLGRGEQGGRTACPVFVAFMKEALKDKPVTNFERPLGVICKGLTVGSVDEDGQEVETSQRFCFKRGEVGPGRRSEPIPEPELEPALELFEDPNFTVSPGPVRNIPQYPQGYQYPGTATYPGNTSYPPRESEVSYQ